MTDIPEEAMGDRPEIPTLEEWLIEQHAWHYEKSIKYARGTVLNSYHCGWVDALSSILSRVRK